MNNITMDDIDQHRAPPSHKCFKCAKEFKFGEKFINDGGTLWTAFDYHPKCFKQYKAACKRNAK